MKRIFLALLAFPIIYTFSCKSRIVMPAPELEAQVQVEELPMSEISIPIQIPYREIELALEKKQGNLIYEDNSYDNNNKDNIKLIVTKTGAFRFQGIKDLIRITLPLKIWFSGQYEACSICPKVETSTEFEANITFSSKITLYPNWLIDTKTESSSFEITKDPYIKLGPLRINIKTLVEKELSTQLKDLATRIDYEIKNSINLKKEADKFWKLIQKPYLVDSTYNAWIRLEPYEFIMAPIVCNDKMMLLKGGLKTRIITSFGSMPAGNTTPLPNITVAQPSSQFKVELEVDLPFKEASKLANGVLKDSVFAVTKNKNIKIDEIDIFGANNEVFIKTFTSLDLHSIFYLKGKPAFDSKTNELYLADLDYDLRTKQGLIKSANWLFKSTIRNKIAKAFRFDLTDQFNAAQASLNGYLQNYTVQDFFLVNGKVNTLKLKSVKSDNTRFYLVLFAEGKAEVKINNLSF